MRRRAPTPAPAARASLLPALLWRHVSRPAQAAAGARRRELPVVQDLLSVHEHVRKPYRRLVRLLERRLVGHGRGIEHRDVGRQAGLEQPAVGQDRKSTRLNSSHGYISYAVFCLKKKKPE